jgi:hypothetical protein
MAKIINPVDSHDWDLLPKSFNAICKSCGIEMWPAFRGLNPHATEVCLGNPDALSASKTKAVVPDERGGGDPLSVNDRQTVAASSERSADECRTDSAQAVGFRDIIRDTK